MSTTSTAAPPTDPIEFDDADQYIEIGAVGWEGYLRYRRARGERSRPKMLYLDGDLILVSPAETHERINYRFGTFMREVLHGLRVQFRAIGQTTLRLRCREIAVEGDQTYYLASEPLVRDKPKVNLQVDPPPDLAIEVVHTHQADHALEVYGRLGVPEVWVCDQNRVAILLLQADGSYAEFERSLALPLLTAAEIFAQTQQPPGVTDLDWMDGVRRWVREVLVPRVPQPDFLPRE